MGSSSGWRSLARSVWASAYILLTATALFWAGNAIVARGAREAVPPVALSFWRWALALLIILPFAWPHLRRDADRLRRQWRLTALLGVLGIGCFNTLLYWGLQSTTALNSMLLQAGQTGAILLLAMVLFGERAGAWKITGAVLALGGALVIISGGNASVLLGLEFNRGDLLIALAVVLWALYSVLLRRRPQVHPLSFFAATLIVGVAAIAPFYLVELAGGARIVAGPESALAIAYVAIFPSVLAYLCFNRGVELIGAAATGQYLNVMPVFGAILAVLFLGERLQAFHFVGAALIAAGIVLARRREQTPGR